jgi:hypothetical protein
MRLNLQANKSNKHLNTKHAGSAFLVADLPLRTMLDVQLQSVGTKSVRKLNMMCRQFSQCLQVQQLLLRKNEVIT